MRGASCYLLLAMGALPGPDAREHPRATARIRVEYHFGTTTGAGHTADISEGGMFLACHEAPQQGARVYLRIYLPGSQAGDPLKIIGVVTRADRPVATVTTRQSGMGIHFEVAYSRTRESLSNFMRTLLIHPDALGQIERLSGPEAAYGVRLSPGPAREEMLSSEELASAFAFDATRLSRPPVADTANRLTVRLLIAATVLAVVTYLTLHFLGALR
jgi:hypothetical protein